MDGYWLLFADSLFLHWFLSEVALQKAEADSEQATGNCFHSTGCTIFCEIYSSHLQACLKFIPLMKNEDIRKYSL